MSDINDNIVKYPELPVIEIVDDLVQVFKEFMVVNSLLKLDFFSWLSENGPATPVEIADGTGIKPEYMPALLGTLFYLDMVRKTGDKFSISPAAQMNFVKSSKFYQGDYLLSFPMSDSPWMEMDKYLTVPDIKTIFDPLSLQSVKAQAEYSIRGTVQNVVNAMKTWKGFSDAHMLLEMNGGHGNFAIAACQINPNLKAKVLTGVADTIVARGYVEKFGMTDRITVTAGNIFADVGEEYDIVLTSHSLYQLKGKFDDVFARIYSILKEGGLFFSNHWFDHPSSGTGMQGLYELELAMHNRYHQLDNREEFERLCNTHNLQLLQVGIIRSQYGESIIHMAEKKGV